MLDQCEAEGTGDLRTLVAALVRPLAAKLGDGDGGPEFLMIQADLANRPQPQLGDATRDGGGDVADSTQRWRLLVEPLIDDEAVRLHRRFTAILHCMVELGRRARSGPHTDDRLFTSYLIDVVTAILSAPVSDETHRLAAERDRARAPKRVRTSGR
jgi:hypothetical protein